MTMATPLSGDAQTPPPRVRTGRTGPILVGVALLSAFATFLILVGFTPIAPTHSVVVTMLAGNAVLVAALLVMVVREVALLRQARRKGQAASRLHERAVRLFAIVASLPVIAVAVVASITLDRGLDGIFAGGVKRAVDASAEVASAYVREQIEQVRAETGAFTGDLNRIRSAGVVGGVDFRRFLTAQAYVRGFAVLRLMRGDGTVIDRADIPAPGEFAAPLPLLEEAGRTDDLLINLSSREERDFIEAILRVQAGLDEFLHIVRPINPRIGEHLRATQLGLFEYRELEQRRAGIQLAFALMFTLVAILVTLSAVYVGLSFANRLVQPIRRLIGAADQVAAGDLNVEIHIRRSEGDLANLGDTFNKMTRQLAQQRADLVSARDQIDSRRRFTEAVLAGVTVGVIGLDEAGDITILNPIAADILGADESLVIGKPLVEIAPEFSGLLASEAGGERRLVQGQIALSRRGRERMLAVRVASERDEAGAHGVVVTVDDITDLVAAQRASAWADVARRIAHEIKNPLTPIQLSAERLKRRYGPVIGEDREVFDRCTDTIIRQVGDIGRMVDEFSSFARMPKAVFGREDLVETVRQVAFLQRVGNPGIDVEEALPATPVVMTFDRRLISQALTNIVKNAAEAIGAVPEAERGRGRILVRLTTRDGAAEIDVIDNGIGLPKENRMRLLEPYVTTRAKGTGLGLAIVGKILEEHGGGLDLLDAPPDAEGRQRGAWLRLRLADQQIQEQPAVETGATPARSAAAE